MLKVDCQSFCVTVKDGDKKSYSLRLKQDLHLKSGSRVWFIAGHGAGKTRLLAALAGLGVGLKGDAPPPPPGITWLDSSSGNEQVPKGWKRGCRGYPWPAAVSARIGYCTQSAVLLSWLTLEENLLLAQTKRLRDAGSSKWLDTSALLESLGLIRYANKRPKDLTPAQRRLGVMGRALVGGPDLVLADYPTLGLAENEQRQLWKAVEAATEKKDFALVATALDRKVLNLYWSAVNRREDCEVWSEALPTPGQTDGKSRSTGWFYCEQSGKGGGV